MGQTDGNTAAKTALVTGVGRLAGIGAGIARQLEPTAGTWC
jgi:hypothetical protein